MQQQVLRLTCEYLQSVERAVEAAPEKGNAIQVLQSVDQLKHIAQNLKPFSYIIPREEKELVILEQELLTILSRVVVYSVTKIETKKYAPHFTVMLSLIKELINTEHVIIVEDAAQPGSQPGSQLGDQTGKKD